MKKLPTLLRTIPAAAISLALILTLSACAAQDSTGTGNGPAQTETTLDDGSLLEAVFSQSDPDNRGRITYYRDKVTDVLYLTLPTSKEGGFLGPRLLPTK